MTLRIWLILLTAAMTLLPAVPAVLITRQIVDQSLDIGLSEQLDQAVEGGVHQSGQLYRIARGELRETATQWAAALAASETPQGSAATLRAELLAHQPEAIAAGDRVQLIGPDQSTLLIQEGQLAASEERDEIGAPPRQIRASVGLENSWTLEIERAVDPQWRQEALRQQDALQLLRLMQAERDTLERSFWLPFVGLYAACLLLAAAAAWLLARGITRPVDGLLAATKQVSRGDWQTRVERSGPSELAGLATGFNAMVHTLDAQSRSLVDLEKMAGWREMARTLAHEIKNPLTPIQLTVEEMQQRYRGDDTEYRDLLDECARIVIEEVESLRNVVGRFREFSRPVELTPTRIDINRLVADVAALQRDLSPSSDLDPSLGELVADADRLRQLFMNIAENSRQALEKRNDGQIRFRTRRTNEGVQVDIEDNGPGIPIEERERVFEPYRSGHHGGLGLGMALAKGIVLAHGGSIVAAESELGGARLSILLPLDGISTPEESA